MYGKEFFARATLQQVCGFLQFGGTSVPEDPGSLEVQYARHSSALNEALHRCRDKVLAEDWDAIPTETKRIIRTEELYSAVLEQIAALEQTAFQSGFAAGLRLLSQAARAD